MGGAQLERAQHPTLPTAQVAGAVISSELYFENRRAGGAKKTKNHGHTPFPLHSAHNHGLAWHDQSAPSNGASINGTKIAIAKNWCCEMVVDGAHNNLLPGLWYTGTQSDAGNRGTTGAAGGSEALW